MNQERKIHLSTSQLIAFAESEVDLDNHTIAIDHLRDCVHCNDLFRFLKSYLPKFNGGCHDEELKFDQCPQSDMDYISLFLTFLKSISETESATQLFKHVNDCYSCCEDFVSDWSDYLGIKANN